MSSGESVDCPTDPSDARALSEWALARGRSLGFAAVGICDAMPSERASQLKAWLAAGHHGSMEWMNRNLAARLDPGKLVHGARSIVVVADRYHDGSPDARPAEVVNPQTGLNEAAGRTARYARGRDYHRRIKKRMRRLQRELEAAIPGARGKVCCDIEPMMEREMSERAGIGQCGKHTLLIVPNLGSWVLLSSYVTTVRLEPTKPTLPSSGDPCGSCTRCIDACPTGAITPWSVDGSKCISGITIEERVRPNPDSASRAGDWLFGCDICQEVCPHNQPTRLSKRMGRHPEYDGRNASFSLLEVLDWDEQTRRTAFGPSALNRVRAAHARRNAVWCSLEVLQRSSSDPLAAVIRRIAEDEQEDPMVREAACEVVGRLRPSDDSQRALLSS